MDIEVMDIEVMDIEVMDIEVMDISERTAKKMCINLNIELSGKNHKGTMH